MNSEEINELAAALVLAQAEFGAVPKGSTNPFFKSKYAALPEVVQHASPVLSKHGLAISQHICTNDNGDDLLLTYLLHRSGQFIAYSMQLHLVKDDPQAQLSAVTYARRGSYMAVLGLVADEDDDGNRASQAKAKQTAAPEMMTQEQIVLKGMLGEKFKVAKERKTFIESVVFHDVDGVSSLTPDEVALCIDVLTTQKGE